MIYGSPDRERPDHDDEPARVTSDDESEPASDDTPDASESILSRIISGARTFSEIVAPFTGLAASIVHLITAYQFVKKL